MIDNFTKPSNFKTLLIIIFLLTPKESISGSCNKPSLMNRVLSSDYVYHGEIIESHSNGDRSVVNKLRIIEKLKSTPDSLSLKSESGKFYRDQLFAVTGFRYLVFGNYGEKPIFTKCSFTEPKYEISESNRKFIKKIANKSLQRTSR